MTVRVAVPSPIAIVVPSIPMAVHSLIPLAVAVSIVETILLVVQIAVRTARSPSTTILVGMHVSPAELVSVSIPASIETRTPIPGVEI